MRRGSSAAWIRKDLEIVDEKIEPNHSYRHYVKSQLFKANVDVKIRDMICDHGANVARRYEHGEIEQMAEAVGKLPDPLGQSVPKCSEFAGPAGCLTRCPSKRRGSSPPFFCLYRAEVPLTKIHHTAFNAHLIGVDPISESISLSGCSMVPQRRPHLSTTGEGSHAEKHTKYRGRSAVARCPVAAGTGGTSDRRSENETVEV